MGGGENSLRGENRWIKSLHFGQIKDTHPISLADLILRHLSKVETTEQQRNVIVHKETFK